MTSSDGAQGRASAPSRADGAHRHGLVGLDGLDQEAPSPPGGPPADALPYELSPEAAATIRSEVERAGGREVCFLAGVDGERRVVAARAVARGNRSAVLAVARDTPTGGLLLHNHPSGDLEPSDADLAVAQRCWEEGLGTAIVDNRATRIYVVVEPPAPKVVHPLDPAEAEAFVAPGGPLSGIHPDYEDREGQRRMLRLVAERYNDGGIQLVEAGTGTGKSVAYLVPAALWAVRNRERTVVSTATINLQEQLVRKDLPLVRRLVDENVEWALVKGRGNYVSIRRAGLAAEGAATLFEDDRSRELSALLDWIGSTEDGSLADLPFVPSDEVWEEVRSDPDICLRARCPHFQQCFYQNSRRRAARARLLVVNHHLLFSDLAVRRATGNHTGPAVLPAYDRLVLDEAHNLEDAATSHLGVEVTRRGLFRLLSRLDRGGKGILTTVQRALSGRGPEASPILTRIEKEVRPALEGARTGATELLDALEAVLPDGRGEAAVRIGGGEGVGEPAADGWVRARLETLLGALRRLERGVEGIRRAIESDPELRSALEERLLDLGSAVRRLGAHQYTLRLVLAPSPEEAEAHVRWLEVRGRGRSPNLALAAAPVELGAVLRESLFERNESIVLTSATLATRRSFGFLRGRLGLDAEGLALSEKLLEVNESILASPFDFRNQSMLGVPTDLPDVRSDDARFQEETARVTEALARVTGGGVFVLFTSYRALRAVARHLRDRGVDDRWPLLVHGEDDRSRLLRAFVESGRGILLGTASFWEGVDVPGHPLRGLILQKLPFRVPTEPVTAARVEAIERRGGDAFREFMLPLAALRLKQGFGRLVRSREDRGAVLVLDDRLVRKRYGAYLRASLPPAPLVRGPWRRVEEALERFYGNAPGHR